MSSKTSITIALILFLIGISLLLWGSAVMRDYEGYLEILKAARKSARPQWLSGTIIMIIGYVLLSYNTRFKDN